MRRAPILGLALAACAACAGLFAGSDDRRLAAWKEQASALRGLPFETPVRLEWISQAQIPDVIGAELDGVLTPEAALRYRDGYAALGVFPPELDYAATMSSLQSESLAGMYSLRRRTLFVLDSLRDDASDASPGRSLIVVHELVHALQHQHFPDTLELVTALRRQDDVVAAVSSALEGDATLTMLGVGGGRDERSAARLRDALLDELARPDGPIAAAPRLLRVSLIYPYALGTPNAARRFGEAGNAGLDAALADPPLSTLRVLAPDDADPVEFVRLPDTELAARLAPRGCTLGDDNVAGALTLRVLFEEYAANARLDALALDWSGDRFLQIDCAGTWELVWLTRWDSPAGAARFASAYLAIADAVTANSPLSGAPEVVVRGRSALVITPGLSADADWLLGASEIRAYASFAQWRADGCFPETPCPAGPR